MVDTCMHTIIVICAVCKKFIDIKDGKGCSGNSHGLCGDCLEKGMAAIKKTPYASFSFKDDAMPSLLPWSNAS